MVNQAMAKLRVKIEHAFTGLKRLRMLKEKSESLLTIRGRLLSRLLLLFIISESTTEFFFKVVTQKKPNNANHIVKGFYRC